MEFVFASWCSDDVAFCAEFGELVGFHGGGIVGVGVRVEEGEVGARVETLCGIFAEIDTVGELGDCEDRGAVRDEIAEDFVGEVGSAGVRARVAAVEAFERVEEAVPFGLGEVFVVVVCVEGMAKVDDDELLVLCSELVDLADDVG